MKVILIYYALVVFNSVCFTNAQFFDFSSLTDQINQQVQQKMQGISNNFGLQMGSLANLQENLSQMGSRIQQDVQSRLEPLNAMRIQRDMAHGIGGTTIATYGDRFTVIYKNGKKYICHGHIIDDSHSIRCSSPLTTKLSRNERICTNDAYTRMNTVFCFGNNISLNCRNNACTCSGGKLYTLDGLKKICSPSFGSNSYAMFTYYPDESNYNHIPLPNPNKYVTCVEDSNTQCTWYGNGLF